MNLLSFSLLVQISITHGYFKNGVFKDLIVKPDQLTAAYCQKTGLLFKSDEKGFSLYKSQSYNELSKLNFKPAVRSLNFELYTSNSQFRNFSQVDLKRLSISVFSTRNTEPDDSKKLSPVTEYKQPNPQQIGLVSLFLDDFSIGGEEGHSTYGVHFEARKSQWNYYLFGHTEDECRDLLIEDSQGNRFEGPGSMTLGDKSCCLYSSGDQTYPMQERPTHFCAIYKKSETRDAPVLIQQLPTASPTSITGIRPEGRDKVSEAESSIYIHL